MEKLIEIKNVTMNYPIKSDFGFIGQKNEFIQALKDINLDIYKGEILGLVGESGCGKSTLGKSVLKLIQPQGSIFYRDKNILKMDDKNIKCFRKEAQMIFQNPYSSLNPRMSVYSILREPLVVHGIRDKKTINTKINKIIELTGISKDDLKRYPHEFSGGQRQRIAIARALILEPEFLVADEPVSALDVSIQAQIIKLLKELKDELNLTVLFISHDLGVVKYISDRIAVMYLGDIVEIATTKELFAYPKHPYTQTLLSAVPTVQNIEVPEIKLVGDIPSPKNPPVACKFHTRCPQEMKICSKHEPVVSKISECHFVKCHLYSN